MLEAATAAAGVTLALTRLAPDPADWPADTRGEEEAAVALAAAPKGGGGGAGKKGGGGGKGSKKAGGAKHKPQPFGAMQSIYQAGEEVKGFGDLYGGLE